MTKETPELTLAEKNQRTAKRLVLLTFVMFGFGFALVPLYNVMCKQLGINGKTSPAAYRQTHHIEEDTSRTVTVEFTTTMNENLPWEFHPMHKKAPLHPGGSIHTAYFAKNLTGKTMAVQAIPSVTPGYVAKHIKKLECFCFSKQVLGPGESAELPLTFVLGPEFPAEVETLTLSYTLFDITDSSS